MTEQKQKPQAAPIQAGGKPKAIVPQNIEEAFRMADAIYLSGMYPESYQADAERRTGKQMQGIDRQATTSRIMVGIQKAMEVGLPPISGLSAIYIVNNRPTIYGDGIPALLYASGKITKFKEWSEGEWGKDDYVWKCQIVRNDMEDPIEREFSWADAKKAGLTGKSGPWTTHPKRQLQMRARGFAARDGAADILNGLGIYEEVIDIPEKAKEVDTSSLDDAPAAENGDNSQQGNNLMIENKPQPAMPLVFESDDLATVGAAIEANDEQLEKIPFSEDDVCQTCNGKGIVEYTQENPETGEIEEGIQPCTCQSPKA